MSDYFLDNYSTNWSEKITFLIAPIYSDRHYEASQKAKSWQGRWFHWIAAGIQRTPILGAIIAIVEAALAAFWFALSGSLNGWDEVLTSPVAKEVKAEKNEVKPAPLPEEILTDAPSEKRVVLPVKPTVKPVPSVSFEKPIVPLVKPTVKPAPSVSVEKKSAPRENQSDLQKATAAILSTHGFEREPKDAHPTVYGYVGEVQGTTALRFATAKATRDFPEAISPAALKEQRDINFEQYLILKLKRFAHAHDLAGFVTLPSGKKFNLEGFCEAFTVPMIASAVQSFAKTNTFFEKKEWEWIVKGFNQTTSSDYTEPDDIQVFSTQIQDHHFRGPLSIGTGYNWHSTGTLFFGNYLIYGNVGSTEPEYGIHVYFLPDRSAVINDGVVWEMTKRQEISGDEKFGLERIVKHLGGQLVFHQKMPTQIVGNCTYKSMLLVLLVYMVIKQILKFHSEEDDPHLFVDPDIWATAFDLLLPVYEKFVAFDQELNFNALIEEIEEWTRGDTAFSNYPLKDVYKAVLSIYQTRQQSLGRPVNFPISVMQILQR